MIDRRGYDNSRPALYTRDSGEINHHHIAWIKQAPRPLDRVQLHTATRRWLNRVDLARSRCHYGRRWPPRTVPDSVKSARRDEAARLVAGHERFLQRLLVRSVPYAFLLCFSWFIIPKYAPTGQILPVQGSAVLAPQTTYINYA